MHEFLSARLEIQCTRRGRRVNHRDRPGVGYWRRGLIRLRPRPPSTTDRTKWRDAISAVGCPSIMDDMYTPLFPLSVPIMTQMITFLVLPDRVRDPQKYHREIQQHQPHAGPPDETWMVQHVRRSRASPRRTRRRGW